MVVFSVVTIAVIFLLGITSYNLMVSHLEENQKLHLIEHARIAAKEVDRTIDDKRTLLFQIAQAREVQDFPTTYRHPLLARHLAEFQSSFPTITFIGTEGIEELKIENGHTSTDTGEFSDSGFLQSRRSPGEVIVEQSPNEGTLILTLGMKNYFGDVFLGSLQAEIPLARLTTHFNDTLVARTGYLGIVNDRGVLFKVNDNPKQNKELFEQRLPTRGINTGFTKIENKAGKQFFIGIAGTKINSWKVVAILPYDEFISGPNRLAWSFVGFGVIFLVVGGAAISSLSARVSVPLHQLVEATHEIAVGHWKEINIKKAPGEIGALVEAFNTMTRSLKTTTVSRDFLDNILESMRESIIVTSLDGKIERTNEATSRMLGYTPLELIGQPISLVIPDTICGTDHWIDKVTRTSGHFAERIYRSKQGEAVPVTFSWVRFNDTEGKTKGMLCIAQQQESSSHPSAWRNRVRKESGKAAT